MSNKWHNKFGAKVIKPKHFSYNKRADDWMKPFDGIKQTQLEGSDDIEAAKTIRQEREEKREELLRKVKTYSKEDKYN